MHRKHDIGLLRPIFFASSRGRCSLTPLPRSGANDHMDVTIVCVTDSECTVLYRVAYRPILKSRVKLGYIIVRSKT